MFSLKIESPAFKKIERRDVKYKNTWYHSALRIPHGIRLKKLSLFGISSGDVTVAPGIAYKPLGLQQTANKVNSQALNLRLSPNDGSLCIDMQATILRSSAFKKYKIILAERAKIVKRKYEKCHIYSKYHSKMHKKCRIFCA